jgi:predicted dehydrogenase
MPWIRGELRGGFVHEVEHFAAAALSGSTPLITGQDGMVALRMAEAIVQSTETHQPVMM